MLDNIKIYHIFPGTVWIQEGMQQIRSVIAGQIQKIANSNYLSALAEYRQSGFRISDPGPGPDWGGEVWASPFTPDPPQIFTSDDVKNMLYTQIETGNSIGDRTPDLRSNNQHLYFVFMPPTVDGNLCQFNQYPSAAGSHGFDQRAGELILHYAFTMTRGSQTGTVVDWDMITWLYSHELVEACTDPEGNGIVGDPGSCGPGSTGLCEIADVCENTTIEIPDIEPIKVPGYWLQSTGRCFAGPVTLNPAITKKY